MSFHILPKKVKDLAPKLEVKLGKLENRDDEYVAEKRSHTTLAKTARRISKFMGLSPTATTNGFFARAITQRGWATTLQKKSEPQPVEKHEAKGALALTYVAGPLVAFAILNRNKAVLGVMQAHYFQVGNRVYTAISIQLLVVQHNPRRYAASGGSSQVAPNNAPQVQAEPNRVPVQSANQPTLAAAPTLQAAAPQQPSYGTWPGSAPPQSGYTPEYKAPAPHTPPHIGASVPPAEPAHTVPVHKIPTETAQESSSRDLRGELLTAGQSAASAMSGLNDILAPLTTPKQRVEIPSDAIAAQPAVAIETPTDFAAKVSTNPLPLEVPAELTPVDAGSQAHLMPVEIQEIQVAAPKQKVEIPNDALVAQSAETIDTPPDLKTDLLDAGKNMAAALKGMSTVLDQTAAPTQKTA